MKRRWVILFVHHLLAQITEKEIIFLIQGQNLMVS